MPAVLLRAFFKSMDEFFYKTDCFSLVNTFNNGQCFRWTQTGQDSFEGVAFGRALRLRQCRDGVAFACGREDFDLWREYFDLDTDYAGIQERYSRDEAILPCVEAGAGMHLLRQELWEVLISFIVSQNNNITRIKGIIRRLCENYGREFEAYGQRFYAFPSAEELSAASAQQLEKLGLGYRADYVEKCAKTVCEQPLLLDNFREMNYNQAREALLNVRGIGPKVANCILLFGLRHLSAFPVDTWIHKAMISLYPECGSTNSQIEAFAAERFGDNAGIAQQYIFYAVRQGKVSLFNQ